MNDAPHHTHLRFMDEELATEFIQRLIDHGLLTDLQNEELRNTSQLTGKSVVECLRESGLVAEEPLLTHLSALSGLPFQNIGEFKIEPETVARVSSRVALRHRVMPLHYEHGVMTLALSSVPTLSTVDGLRMIMDAALEWVLCTESDIATTLTHFYGLGAETIDQIIAETDEDEDAGKDEDIAAKTSETGVVRFINMLIAEAIRMEATDIHIEPYETTMRLRYRIDGILQEIPLPKGVEKLKRAVSSAVKIMANLDISERRKPHDGRIKIRYGSGEYDLRVSVLPTGYGETICMRILNRSSMFIDLDNLGLSPVQLPKIKLLTDLPHGVLLLTGPTGSGKTTTLYALLSRINKIGVKIITVEDPVEYQMQGINQVQAHSQIGLTFANVLRSILRHDPDVVLIGEIRDSETADIAVRASLTGHLVLSTLHTNDAPSSITRLTDMGIEPYLIASCLEGAIAQRLIRRVCKYCQEPADPPPGLRGEILAAYPDREADLKFVRGHGCPACSFTGYRGRCAITEVMLMSDNIRSMVVDRLPANKIKEQAMLEGMGTLRSDGWLRLIEGRTTFDEILRVAGQTGA